jgi:hypothetical protein
MAVAERAVSGSSPPVMASGPRHCERSETIQGEHTPVKGGTATSCRAFPLAPAASRLTLPPSAGGPRPPQRPRPLAVEALGRPRRGFPWAHRTTNRHRPPFGPPAVEALGRIAPRTSIGLPPPREEHAPRHCEQTPRHCERSEAIQCEGLLLWIASGYALAMTASPLLFMPQTGIKTEPYNIALLGNAAYHFSLPTASPKSISGSRIPSSI